jgi:hypothetical protein
MQQKILIAVIAFASLAAQAVNIPLGNRAVTYTQQQLVTQTNLVRVAAVRVQSIFVQRVATNTVAALVPFQWLDATGRVVRTGTRSLTETQLAQFLGAKFAAQKTALLALIPANAILYSSLTLRLGESGTLTAIAPFVETVNGVMRTGSAAYDEAALTTRSVDVAALKALLPAVADALVR